MGRLMSILRFLTGEAAGFERVALTHQEQPLETPRQLSRRYFHELQELVSQGEISAAIAQRILDDLFEPGDADQPPMIRGSVWCAYAEDLTKERG